MFLIAAMKRFGLLFLVWCGFWSCASFASPKGYYLGWAEVSPVGRAIRVSFNPIDCNVASLVSVMKRRALEADPIRVIAPEMLGSPQVPVESAANRISPSCPKQTGSLAHSSVQNPRYGSEAFPTLARISAPDGKDGMKSLSGCCHILLFYGRGPTDLPYFTSGELALKALTDEEAAVAAFDKSPFIRTRNGVRYLLSNDPVFHSDVGESHQDQCLATFAALNLPLNTPIHLKSRSYSISDLLSESVANFSFDQKELAWSALAFAKYVPPKREWVNRFRERTSFSRLVQYLLRRNLNSESCAGTHIFQALIQIDNAERKTSVLDKETRKELDSYLTAKLKEVVRRQQEDGSWSKQWCNSVNDEIGTMTSFQMSFLVTGHLLEVLNILDSQMRPPHAVYVRAAEWVGEALKSVEIRPDGSWVCPLTHSVRSAREILPRLDVDNPFHHTRSAVDLGVTNQEDKQKNNKK